MGSVLCGVCLGLPGVSWELVWGTTGVYSLFDIDLQIVEDRFRTKENTRVR